jgi:hypothetical protein
MDVGLLLPYFLLILTVLEEHYAVWSMFFFIIPLLDVMFYVEIPDKTIMKEHWCRMCVWMWFPLVFYTACYTNCSYPSMISMGILYNSTLCLADELVCSGAWYEDLMGDLISDFLGFVRLDYYVSVVRFCCFFYVMMSHHRLLWHIGSIFIGSILYEYICWAERRYYPTGTVSHYGLANYSMFRFYHSKDQLLPTSYMWILCHLFLNNLNDYLKLE